MYLNNKYTICYYNIINQAKSRTTLSKYTELHHIVPKSMGGTNKKDNLVNLTAREHFLCHKLLTKMTEGTNKRKMLYALGKFIQSNPHQQRILTATQYEAAKRALSLARIGQKHSDEAKAKMSEKAKLRPKRTYPNRGPRTPESRLKNSLSMKKLYQNKEYIHKGKSYEDLYGPEEAELKKAKLRGPKGPRKNPTKKHDLITCPHCNKTGGAGNMHRYHFNNCRIQNGEKVK